MTEFIMIIKDLGFPIFVAIYLLVFMHKSLESNREALLTLKESNDFIINDIHEIRQIVQSCERRGQNEL